MNIIAKLKRVTIALLLLAIAPEILAIDMDYYTPNGLPTIGEAFKRMALIFSDREYSVMFAGIAILAMLIGAINGTLITPLTKGMNAGNSTNWLATFFLGSAVYMIAFVPTATMHVYDPVKNDTQSVAGVPQIIVLIAGMANLVERTMIDITSTGTAYPYDKNAGGINLELFLNAIKKGAKVGQNRFLNHDVQEFYEKCGKINLSIPGNTGEEEFFRGMQSPYAVLSEWTHPGITVNIHEGTSSINNMTCTDAWNNYFKHALKDIEFEDATEEVCASSGFAIGKPTQLQSCKDLLAQAYEYHGLSKKDARTYIREAFISNSIISKINADDPDAATRALLRKQLVLQGLGATTAASDTQPQLRAVMTAIILGLIPFLTLFLVTPMWSKALKFITGAILWLTTWGVMMAVAHTGVMDSAMAVATELEKGKMGLDAFMFAETDAIKMMALFGKMQSNAMMMATAIAVAVYGFGSYAMTGLAQSMSGNMGQLGEKATEQSMTPQGRKAIRDAQIGGIASDGGVALQNAMTNQDTSSFANTGSQHQAKSAALSVGTEQAKMNNIDNVAATANTSGAIQAGDILGRNAGVSAVADKNNLSATEQVTNTATTSAMNQQSAADAQKYIHDNLTTDGTQVDGAEQLAMNSAYQQFGGVDNVRNMTRLNGGSPFEKEDVMATMTDMRNNNNGLSMTGQQIMNNDKLMQNRQDDWKDFVSDHKDDNFMALSKIKWVTPLKYTVNFTLKQMVKNARYIHPSAKYRISMVY